MCFKLTRKNWSCYLYSDTKVKTYIQDNHIRIMTISRLATQKLTHRNITKQKIVDFQRHNCIMWPVSLEPPTK
ncbi:MAG: hypothetical protein ACJAZ2_000442 [Glaciecola sp.]|jgi:hypothetical protein